MFNVIVSHGNQKQTVFSRHETRADAEKLKAFAKTRGYKDAKIETDETTRPPTSPSAGGPIARTAGPLASADRPLRDFQKGKMR